MMFMYVFSTRQVKLALELSRRKNISVEELLLLASSQEMKSVVVELLQGGVRGLILELTAVCGC